MYILYIDILVLCKYEAKMYVMYRILLSLAIKGDVSPWFTYTTMILTIDVKYAGVW